MGKKTTTRPTARAAPRRSNEAGDAPNRAALHEAALAYLARGAASADSAAKTLARRVGNWARRAARGGRDGEAIEQEAAAARELIPGIVARLVEVGLINDGRFAEARAKRMSSAGRSRRAITAHLAQKGIDEATVREALPRDPSAELNAALAFARKRRLGPFARETATHDPETSTTFGDAGRAAEQNASRKALATMARAGFDFRLCQRVLRMDRGDAEERLRAAREF